MSSEGALPPKQQELYAFLHGKGDTAIIDIGRIVAPRHMHDGVTVTEAHQRITYFITRMNRRLRAKNQVVRPGRLKGTYCLTSI